MEDKSKYGISDDFTTFMHPTNACNLACKYCYVNEDMKKEIMNEETLENSIKKIAFFNGKDKKTHFLWHGGEPLLVGLDFYKKAVRIQGEIGKGYKFDNSIQTNGTLINEETADFFKEYNFSVGLSLDGPEELNDKTRVYNNFREGNKGTFQDILNSIKILKERGIDANVIVTLNHQNIKDVGGIYQFLKNHRLNARFNPIVRAGRAIKNYGELSISPEEFEEAKLNLFDTWFSDTEPIHLYCFEEMLKNILSKNYLCECTFSDSCQKGFISITPQGDVYPCGEFHGIEEFRYGNINKNSLEEIFSHPLRKKLLERGKSIEECALNCEYQELCHGGCMSNAYGSTGNIMDRDPYCLAYKSLFRQINHKIKYSN